MQLLRDYFLALKVGEELRLDLCQSLFRKEVGVALKLFKGHKLDYVSFHMFLIGMRIQRLLICIKALHTLEVLLTDPYNDDGEW